MRVAGLRSVRRHPWIAAGVAAAVGVGGAGAAVTTASASKPQPLTSQFRVVNGAIEPATGTPMPASRSQAMLWANDSYATTTISGSGRLLVGAIGENCDGWPTIEATVDGKKLGMTTIVDSHRYGTYGFGKAPGAKVTKGGSHEVTLRFINDFWPKRCDRNVRLSYARFENAPASAAPTAPAGSASATPTSTPTTGSSGGATVLGLDSNGNRIPDTNYPIPAGAKFLSTSGSDSNPGTQAAPWRSVNKAVDSVPNGGTIVVRGGVYRDGYLSEDKSTYGIQNKTLTIQAFPHEQVWFDGTDVVATSAWKSDGKGHWSMPWSTPGFCQNAYYSMKFTAQSKANNGPCAHWDMYGDPTNPAAADPQMAFVDGKALTEVLSLAKVDGGSFFYDWSARRMWIGTNPAGRTVEAAKRPVFLVMGGPQTQNNKFLGLGFRRYATNEYDNQTSGALTVYGDRTVVENSVFTRNAGRALQIGPRGAVIRHNALVRNGFNGFGSNGHSLSDKKRDGLLVEDNLIANNNTERFGTGCSLSCAQAGVKIAHMGGFTIRNNVVRDNSGWGLWCDQSCTDGVYANNTVLDNSRGGIMYEISSRGIIAGNLIRTTDGHVGIAVASATTKVYNNTVIGSYTDYAANIWVYDDPRYIANNGAGEVGPDTRGVEVVNNVVSGSIRKVLVQGTRTDGTNTLADQLISRMDHNVYNSTNGANTKLITVKGPRGDANFATPEALAKAKGWDRGSTLVTGGATSFFAAPGSERFALKGSFAGGTVPADVATAMGVTAGVLAPGSRIG